MTNQGFDDIPHITKPRIPESFWITFFHLPAWNQNTNFSFSETSRITFLSFSIPHRLQIQKKGSGNRLHFLHIVSTQKIMELTWNNGENHFFTSGSGKPRWYMTILQELCGYFANIYINSPFFILHISFWALYTASFLPISLCFFQYNRFLPIWPFFCVSALIGQLTSDLTYGLCNISFFRPKWAERTCIWSLKKQIPQPVISLVQTHPEA